MTAVPIDFAKPAVTAVTRPEVRDLVVRYGSGRKAKRATPAVDGVSFDLAAGETLGIVGESGSGKSTIGKAVLGLQKPTSGTVRLQGTDITSLSLKQRRSLAVDLRVVFQDPYSSLNPARTIGQTLVEPLRLLGVGEAEADKRSRESLRLGRAAGRGRRALPVAVLRRSAAAGRHRPGAGLPAQGRRPRRAGQRTGSVVPGAGAEPAGGSAGTAQPGVPVHRARPRRRPVPVPACRGAVPRPGDGVRSGRVDHPAAPPSRTRWRSPPPHRCPGRPSRPPGGPRGRRWGSAWPAPRSRRRPAARSFRAARWPPSCAAPSGRRCGWWTAT